MATGGSYLWGKEEIVKFICEKFPDSAKTKILDVGAGGGNYGYLLGRCGYKLEAVEIWPESIEALKKTDYYTEIYAENIVDYTYRKSYDLLIFGDILEHLTVENAQKVLKEAEKHTKSILVAVPYLYEQDDLYGNEAEIHLQPDLTYEIFNKRYPGYTTIMTSDEIGYGYFFKDIGGKKKKMATKKNKLCVYAICKNESKFVEKWLDNMSGADYIVVLDTGSTDDTYEKLKNDPRVTKVVQKEIKPWRFDVARNESMKLIPKDANILVCTDFDELFSDKNWADIVRDNWKDDITRMHYTYAWSHNEIGEPTDVFTYDKIHTKDYYWKFPVHEVLWRDDSENEVALDLGNNVFLHHYQDKEKSRKSYFDLLQLSVQEFPEDSHVRMLLAREYLLNMDFDNALENYLAVLKMPDVDAPEKKLILLESLGRCADIYKVKENYDEAIWYAQEFIKEDYTYREPYLILAEIYNNMKMYTLAEAMVLQALKYSTRKNTWVERADTWVSLPQDILSYAYYNLGQLDKAVENAKIAVKHHPTDIRILQNYIAFLEESLGAKPKKAEQ